MPKKGPDPGKVKKIIDVLSQSGKRGIWMRELSRQTNIPFTTVFYYLYNHMRDDISIEDIEFSNAKSSKFKIVRLKRFS